MAYNTNHFCWFEIKSSDKSAAAAFYPEAVGWKIEEADMGPQGRYTMFLGGDIPRGGIAETHGGAPSHWNAYLRVEDVAATTTAAAENGGKVLMAPMAIPGVGVMSVIASPTGAVFSLMRESDEAGSTHPPAGLGGIHWTELHSQDVDADLAWLTKTFGYETATMPMPDGSTYHLLKTGPDTMAGGLMKAMNPQVPSMWLNWVWVDDVDETLIRVERNGGTAHSPPMDMPGVGRMAVVADPTGAVFGVITPTS